MNDQTPETPDFVQSVGSDCAERAGGGAEIATSQPPPVSPEAHLRSLQNYLAVMGPHQKDRMGGKLLIQSEAVIKGLLGQVQPSCIPQPASIQ